LKESDESNKSSSALALWYRVGTIDRHRVEFLRQRSHLFVGRPGGCWPSMVVRCMRA
jgi:hypothetical protein